MVSYRSAVPQLFSNSESAAKRTFEFFAVTIRNANTRRAYARGVAHFANWCAERGITDVNQVQPLHVAAHIETLNLAPSSVIQRLAALRMLFDWLVIGQVITHNPAASVRGPRQSAKSGKTKVLSAQEVRALLDSIDVSTTKGLRDRALIALMVLSFARVGATVAMKIDDVYTQNKQTWIRLREKGGKRHELPCSAMLTSYLRAYIDSAPPKGKKGWLFRSCIGRTGMLSDHAMAQADVYRMITRRAQEAGVHTKIGCHSFRATGITEYLKAGGRLDVAQTMANHESPRTTALYDRREDRITQSEVERLVL
jgi:site-specific recombinase XerD